MAPRDIQITLRDEKKNTNTGLLIITRTYNGYMQTGDNGKPVEYADILIKFVIPRQL